MGRLHNESHAVREVFGEVAAGEIGYKTACHLLHRRENSLKGLDGLKLGGQRLCIRTFVIVEDCGYAAGLEAEVL